MDSSPSSRPNGPFIPLLLLSASVLLLLAWQLFISWNTRGTLRGQFEQRKPLVLQSKQVQDNVQKLINDLITLSATDADAKNIVEKYNIRRNPPKGE